MWKKHLSTDADPANGKWYERGANGDNFGLYGGLTGDAETELKLDESQKDLMVNYRRRRMDKKICRCPLVALEAMLMSERKPERQIRHWRRHR